MDSGNLIRKIIQEELNKFFNEGGWISKKTQETKLNPMVIKAADRFTKNLISQFNSWLERNHKGIEGLKPIRPVGSGIYYEKDIEENPDKIYGDIDYLVEYPVIQKFGDEKKDESMSVRFYNQELFKFFDEVNPKGVVIEDSKGRDGSTGVIIAEVEPDKFVQIDFVATHAEYKDWSIGRFTPIRNVKGFVSGRLYSALAEALLISIGGTGARAKLKNNIVVPYTTRKGTEEKIITKNFALLASDVANFFSSLTGKGFKTTIKDFDIENLSLSGMVNTIQTLGVALEESGALDGRVTKFNSKEEFYAGIKKIYISKMGEVLENPKFKKAESPKAIEARDKIFKLTRDSIKEIDSLL